MFRTDRQKFQISVPVEHIELPAKLLEYFLRSNKSNINQQRHGVDQYASTHLSVWVCANLARLSTALCVYVCLQASFVPLGLPLLFHKHVSLSLLLPVSSSLSFLHFFVPNQITLPLLQPFTHFLFLFYFLCWFCYRSRCLCCSQFFPPLSLALSFHDL